MPPQRALCVAITAAALHEERRHASGERHLRAASTPGGNCGAELRPGRAAPMFVDTKTPVDVAAT